MSIIYEGYNNSAPYCEACGQIVEGMHTITENGLPVGYCDDCFEEHFYNCQYCGELHYIGDLIEDSRGNLICDYCISYNYRQCSDCGEYYDIDDAEGVYLNGHDWVCFNCLDNIDYAVCDSCGEAVTDYIYSDFGDSYFCGSCYEYAEEGILPSYHSQERGAPIVMSDEEPTSIYYGLELEVEFPQGSMLGFVEEFKSSTTYKYGEAIIESDSSLRYGLEIVTAPLSYKTAMNTDILERILIMYQSHEGSAECASCGGHVHVSKAAFGEGIRREVAINNLLTYIWAYPKLYHDLAGRDNCNYAQRLEEGHAMQGRDRVFTGKFYEVNTGNTQTVEFRLFSGTDDLDLIKTRVQWIASMVEYARTVEDGENPTLQGYYKMVDDSEYELLKTFIDEKY